MDYNWNITIENVRDFDLRQIFDCGQCFRWKPTDPDNTDAPWIGIAGSRPAVVGYDAECELLLIFDMSGEPAADFWFDYFDLGRDYGEIKSRFSEDPSMAEAIAAGSGIRILKQEPWEALVSFIVSQNNNITRIRGCIESLAREAGAPVGGPEISGVPEFYRLPTPQELATATIEELAPCRLGYRAKYLIETGRQVSDNTALCVAAGLDPEKDFLDQLGEPGRDGGAAVEALRNVCGVGPKVANCVSLFGLAKIDCFPIDVWMKRVMNRVYGIDEADLRGMQEYAAEHFAPYGGIAQQYLFNYIARQS